MRAATASMAVIWRNDDRPPSASPLVDHSQTAAAMANTRESPPGRHDACTCCARSSAAFALNPVLAIVETLQAGLAEAVGDRDRHIEKLTGLPRPTWLASSGRVTGPGTDNEETPARDFSFSRSEDREKGRLAIVTPAKPDHPSFFIVPRST